MAISKKDQRALVLCGSFLAIVVVYMCGIDPYLLRYEAAQASIAEHEKDLASLRRKKRLLKPRQRKLRAARLEFEQMIEKFGGQGAGEDRLSESIRSFQKAASDTGAVLHSIRPLPSLAEGEADPNFAQFRFELNFSGSYATVQRMLYQLETGRFLHKTRQIDLKFDKGTVVCRMLAERYYYHEAQPVVVAESTTESEG